MKRFIDNLVLPSIVIIITPFLIALSSKIGTGNWFNLFSSISIYYRITFFIFVGVWYTIVLVRRRIKFLAEQNSGIPVAFARMPAFGWKTINTLEFSGLIWRLRTPAPEPWKSLNQSQILANDIEIENPPRCPKCKTEIEESRNFWGKYLWECYGCGFKKTNKHSYYREGKRAEKVARRRWENKNT